MTSLVTGGAGFIGSHVARHLLDAGHTVIILDDLSGGFEENIPEGALFVQGTILDEALLYKIFSLHKIDFVYHLAAYAAEGLSHFIRRFNYQNNVVGSVNLINLAVRHKVKCFVFTSSIAVYGAGQCPMVETNTPKPEDPYGIAKYAVELDLQAAHKMFGLDYIIFRPHNVYGERQHIGDKYRNVIGIFMNQILQDKPLTIFGDGEQTRAFSYVEDVAPYISEAIENKTAYNRIFNLGVKKRYTINELSKAVIKAMGNNTMLKYLNARNEVQHVYADHSLFHEVFNVQNETCLEDGLARMAAWVKSQGYRKTNDFKNIEIAEKLPEGW